MNSTFCPKAYFPVGPTEDESVACAGWGCAGGRSVSPPSVVSKHFAPMNQCGQVLLIIYKAENRNLKGLCLALSQVNKGGIHESLSHTGKVGVCNSGFPEHKAHLLISAVFQGHRSQTNIVRARK